MNRLTFVSCVAATLAMFAQGAPAQIADARTAAATPSNGESVPRLIQFSGLLKDSAARPVSGAASVTFAIYAEQEGGAALWSETQNVLADANGHYAAVLGAATTGGFPAELFGTGQSRWLGVTIARQPELARVLLASVPYALKAGDADTLGGLPASSYVTTQQLASHAITPTLSGSGATVIATPGIATAQAAQPVTSAPATDATQAVTQTTPTSSGTTNFIPLWTSSTNLGNSLLFQTGGKLGLGITTPASTLDINGGEILRGGFYEYPEDVATASNGGRPSHSFQWLASSFNSSTKQAVDYAFGFRAVQLNNNTSTPAAKLDLFYGTGGPTGTITDTGLSINSAGAISFVPSQTFTGTSESLSGVIKAFIVDIESTALDPVFAKTTSDDANAVSGIATGFGATGVYASGPTAIEAISSTVAADLVGKVEIFGTLTKTAGSFKIDHPLDPANKYLSHSFVESPDMMNIYNGNVTTDANGFASVTMPEWFESLNRDFRYQLTTIGQPAQAWVATELADHVFAIRTDKPNVKVSWQITGVRQDAYANAHRIPVEEEKSEAEKGHYIHPELFGHPEEVSIGAMRHGSDGKLVPYPRATPIRQQ
jgi:hypothetical protein